MRKGVFVLGAGIAISIAAEARADEPVPDNVEPPPPTESPIEPTPTSAPRALMPRGPTLEPPTKIWYGWQTLMVDVSALAMALTAAGEKSMPLAITAGSIYLLAPPVIHWTHGNVGIGFVSLGARAIVPPAMIFGGVLIGFAAGDFYAGVGLGLLGFLVGYPAVVALDAGVFSYEKHASSPPAGLIQTKRFAISPTWSTQKDRTIFGLAGQFE